MRIEPTLPSALEVGKGERFSLTCEAFGRPAPAIHWLWNGHRICDHAECQDGIPASEIKLENPNDVALKTDEVGITKSRLTIDCADETIMGVYTCVAASYSNGVWFEKTENVNVGLSRADNEGKYRTFK